MIVADENIPALVVEALRAAGHDVTYITEIAAGIDDDEVLERARALSAILLTADKDFGELAFKVRAPAIAGIVLFRLAGLAPEEIPTRAPAGRQARAVPRNRRRQATARGRC